MSRPLQPDERLLSATQVDRIYRLPRGTCRQAIIAGSLPAAERPGPYGIRALFVHPDDALSAFGPRRAG